MLKYNKYGRSSFFLAPDGASSGGVGNPGASQGGAAEGAGNGAASEVDPFAGIDLNDLDPDARKVIEAGKVKFASLQKDLTEQRAKAERELNEKRKFQSDFDSLKSQLQRQLNGGNGQQDNPADQAREVHLKKFTKILMDRNVPEPQARVQAEIMLDMMSDFGTTLKGEIGRDLAPFAGSVVQREAEAAWQHAMQTDKVGALQIPEVAQVAWSQVETLVQQGQQVTPEIVKNLTGMAYLKHLESGGAAATNQPTAQPPMSQSQPPTMPSMGRATYPGAGAAPFRPTVTDPNAARTVLDPATDAALQTVMSKWDVKPKGYRGPK